MLLISFTWVNPLKWSTITWEAQIHALVSLPDNCGTNPGWSDWSLPTENESTSLLSVSLRMDPYLFPFWINFCLLSVPNIYDGQKDTLLFKSKNCAGRTTCLGSLKMDSGCKQDNLSCHYLNSRCKCDSTSGNMIFWIFLVWDSWIILYNLLMKLELIQCLEYYLVLGTPWWLPLCLHTITWCCTVCYKNHWYLYTTDTPYNFVPHLCIL